MCSIGVGRRHEFASLPEHPRAPGLAYSVYSDISPYTDTGCLMVCAGHFGGIRCAKLVDSVLKEFIELKQVTVPDEEYAALKIT